MGASVLATTSAGPISSDATRLAVTGEFNWSSQHLDDDFGSLTKPSTKLDHAQVRVLL